jgi:hypothetical protein
MDDTDTWMDDTETWMDDTALWGDVLTLDDMRDRHH